MEMGLSLDEHGWKRLKPDGWRARMSKISSVSSIQNSLFFSLLSADARMSVLVVKTRDLGLGASLVLNARIDMVPGRVEWFSGPMVFGYYQCVGANESAILGKILLTSCCYDCVLNMLHGRVRVQSLDPLLCLI